MLNDLGDMEIGKPVLPAHWGETKPVSEFHGKRHDERELKQLLNTLDKNDGGILRVRAPELPPVEKSTAGACHSCRLNHVSSNRMYQFIFFFSQSSNLRCSICSDSGGRRFSLAMLLLFAMQENDFRRFVFKEEWSNYLQQMFYVCVQALPSRHKCDRSVCVSRRFTYLCFLFGKPFFENEF